jgi:uncharacterized cupin superfamily protein
MQKVIIRNTSDVATVDHRSPKHTFAALRKNLTEALGSPRDIGIWGGGHPFDVEHVVIPAGKPNFPYHAHAAMWEFYWILSGTGVLRLESGEHPIQSGHFFMCGPGEAHQISAGAEHDLEYIVISDNVMADLIYYPDSQKWNAKPGRRIFREQIDYFDGEEA